MKKITILTASPGQNLELAKKAESYLQSQGASVKILNLVDLDLPLYTPKQETIHNPATLVQPYLNDLEAQGFLICSPEYNGGLPPALTNFFAWISRASKDWRKSFNGKPAIIATFSGGGMYVLPSLRIQLSHMGMNVIGRQIHTTHQKVLNPEDLNAVCDLLLKAIA